MAIAEIYRPRAIVFTHPSLV